MDSPRTTTEQAFEEAIEKSLIEKGAMPKGKHLISAGNWPLIQRQFLHF